jgi:hypothetical protein
MVDQRMFQDGEAALASWLVERPPGLIVFDGLPAAGKTTLARNIGARLRWPHIALTFGHIGFLVPAIHRSHTKLLRPRTRSERCYPVT